MAGITSTITSTRVVSKSNRCVFLITASGVSGDAITGWRAITLGITASAFGDLTGDSGITSGTAKLASVYSSAGGAAAGAVNYASWTVASGATATHTNAADKTAQMFGVHSAVGSDDYAKMNASIRQVYPEGKVTVTLDNMRANNSTLYAYGTMILEFMI